MQGYFFCSECNAEYSITWKAYSKFGTDEEEDLSDVEADDDYPQFCPFCSCESSADLEEEE